MAIFGIAAAALFLSIIGAAVVLGFAGFKGQDSSKSFGMYLGFVAAVFALLAVLGIVASLGMLVAQGGRDGGDVTPMGPGRGQGNSRVEDRPGGNNQQGPGNRQGPMGQKGNRPGDRNSSATPNSNAGPNSNPTGDIAESDQLDPDEEEVIDDILGEGSEAEAPKQSIQLTAASTGNDSGSLNQARGKGGPGAMTGRNKTLIAVGSLVASIALGGFSVILFLWSLDLTGRRAWRKNKNQGSHVNSIPQPSQPEFGSEQVTSGATETGD